MVEQYSSTKDGVESGLVLSYLIKGIYPSPLVQCNLSFVVARLALPTTVG
jgi:hypothetical protein